MMCRMVLSEGRGSKYQNTNIEDRPAKSCAQLNQNPNIVTLGKDIQIRIHAWFRSTVWR